MEDTGSLDELANDLATNHVLNDHALYSRRIHPIIQRSRAARSRQRGKPTAERRCAFWYQLAHEHIGPLRTAPEAALPHQVCALARVVRLQRRSEHLVESGGTTPIAAFGASADDDLKATWRDHRASSVPAYLVVDQRILDRGGEALLRARIRGDVTQKLALAGPAVLIQRGHDRELPRRVGTDIVVGVIEQ